MRDIYTYIERNVASVGESFLGLFCFLFLCCILGDVGGAGSLDRVNNHVGINGSEMFPLLYGNRDPLTRIQQ